MHKRVTRPLWLKVCKHWITPCPRIIIWLKGNFRKWVMPYFIQCFEFSWHDVGIPWSLDNFTCFHSHIIHWLFSYSICPWIWCLFAEPTHAVVDIMMFLPSVICQGVPCHVSIETIRDMYIWGEPAFPWTPGSGVLPVAKTLDVDMGCSIRRRKTPNMCL